jgi:hypothetical protein
MYERKDEKMKSRILTIILMVLIMMSPSFAIDFSILGISIPDPASHEAFEDSIGIEGRLMFDVTHNTQFGVIGGYEHWNLDNWVSKKFKTFPSVVIPQPPIQPFPKHPPIPQPPIIIPGPPPQLLETKSLDGDVWTVPLGLALSFNVTEGLGELHPAFVLPNNIDLYVDLTGRYHDVDSNARLITVDHVGGTTTVDDAIYDDTVTFGLGVHALIDITRNIQAFVGVEYNWDVDGTDYVKVGGQKLPIDVGLDGTAIRLGLNM